MTYMLGFLIVLIVGFIFAIKGMIKDEGDIPESMPSGKEPTKQEVNEVHCQCKLDELRIK